MRNTSHRPPLRGWTGSIGLALVLASCAGSTGQVRGDAVAPLRCGRAMQVEASTGQCASLRAEVVLEEVSFPSGATPGGQVELVGVLSRPKFSPEVTAPAKLPAILLIGGSGPSSRRGAVPGDVAGLYEAPIAVLEDLAMGLTQQGYVVLRTDKRSCTPAVVPECSYASEVARRTTWADLVGDVVAASAFLSRQPGVDAHDIIVMGHSHGGTLALEAAAQLDGVSAVVLLGALYYPIDAVMVRQINWQVDAFRESMTRQEIEEAGQQQAAIESGLLAIREGNMPEDALFMGASPAFWKAWIEASSRTEMSVQTARVPILYMRGGEDENASADDSDGFRAALKGQAGEVKVLPGHNHAPGRVGGVSHVSELALRELVEWLGRAPDGAP